MTKNPVWLWFATLVVALLGVGCVASVADVEEGDGVPLGTITFTERDPDRGILRGNYDYEGDVIDFEVIRGAENPIELPMGRRYAADARLCDGAGFCFALLGGGHSIENPSWLENPEESVPDASRARRNHEASWALHHDLLFLDRGEFAGLEEELSALEAVSEVPDPLELPPIPESPTSQNYEPTTPETGVVSYSLSAYSYTHWIQIWRRSLAVVGEHSATRSISQDSWGSWVRRISTCNHGTCAAELDMRLYCSRSFASRPLELAVSTRCVAAATSGTGHTSGDTASCCSSRYDATRYGYHNCNDDSHLQRDMIVNNSSIVPSYCRDWPEVYAPWCS